MSASPSDRDPARAEQRAALFEMIAELAALASRRGEKEVAVMLTAIVTAYE